MLHLLKFSIYINYRAERIDCDLWNSILEFLTNVSHNILYNVNTAGSAHN